MPPAETDDDKPIDPDLRQFVRNLAIADARRDHLIATGQLTPEAEAAPENRARAGSRKRKPRKAE